jgi:hypothetical protein
LVIVHCHPAKGAWHQTVMKVLKDLDVSADEFQAWLRGGRKRRRPD